MSQGTAELSKSSVQCVKVVYAYVYNVHVHGMYMHNVHVHIHGLVAHLLRELGLWINMYATPSLDGHQSTYYGCDPEGTVSRALAVSRAI